MLIGSVGRKNFLKESDIDICRINSELEVARKPEWPLGPISYIDYDEEIFEHLYGLGSLFIYHILFEGVLLKGNYDQWETLRKNFKVKEEFKAEIIDIYDSTIILRNLDMFGGQFMSLYSNLFTVVKNFSIFYLATTKQYFFHKETSIKYVFGDFYFELLQDSYNYFERGIQSDKWDFSSKRIAEKVTMFYLTKMEELCKC